MTTPLLPCRASSQAWYQPACRRGSITPCQPASTCSTCGRQWRRSTHCSLGWSRMQHDRWGW